jgi:RNA polymerase sigma factor (sigma-70 family)
MAHRPLHTLLGRLRKAAAAHGGGQTDGQLLERFVRGRDEAAFEALLRRHGPMVWSVCRRLLRHEQDAEDTFQAAFLILARKARSIGKREAVGSWLYRVAYRTALRARARAAERAAREQPVVDLPAAEAVPDLIWRDLRPVLDEEVNRLPERYRSAFVLCYLEGRTNAEAARELGCPEGTILSRLFWARRRLRSRLARRGVLLSGGTLAGLLAEQAAAMPAALAVAAGRAPAGASVTSLMEGVLRAMWLTKLKIVASLLLTAGVVVGGTGMLAYGVLGTGQPGAQAEEQPLSKPAQAPQGLPPPAAQPRREADQDLLQAEKERLQVEKERLEAEKQERERERAQAKDQVNRLEAVLQKQEEQWSDELIEARKQLLIAEEQLRRLERRQAAQRERGQEQVELRRAEEDVLWLQNTLREMAAREKNAELSAGRRQLSLQLDEARAKLRKLEPLVEKLEQQRTEELIEARQKVVIAEERLRQLERRQATQRERTQAQLQAADERIRQLQGAPSQPAPAQGRIQELERKVDQLLREMAELRREMRRKPLEEK